MSPFSTWMLTSCSACTVPYFPENVLFACSTFIILITPSITWCNAVTFSHLRFDRRIIHLINLPCQYVLYVFGVLFLYSYVFSRLIVHFNQSSYKNAVHTSYEQYRLATLDFWIWKFSLHYHRTFYYNRNVMDDIKRNNFKNVSFFEIVSVWLQVFFIERIN